MEKNITRYSLMISIYKNILPQVNKELKYWKKRAEEIPEDDLREQALSSIAKKDFHSQGGAIYGLLVKKGMRREKCIKFIVAYQTISDYLDNLCDSSLAQCEKDFRELHISMTDIFARGSLEEKNYYRYRHHQDDGRYLSELVATCREILESEEISAEIVQWCGNLAAVYCELQVNKHIAVQLREERLISWFEEYKENFPDLTWGEFSACTGSTLGIFCLISYGLWQKGEFTVGQIEKIYNAYFPYIQGAHILFDYFIDQEEDIMEGSLNFCSYYQTNDEMYERLLYFLKKALGKAGDLPDEKFHKLLIMAIVGVYLADPKTSKQKYLQQITKKLISEAGSDARFFFRNRKFYNRVKKIMQLK